MSDPHDPTGIGKPPRAEPLQPDRPGSGDATQPKQPADDAAVDDADAKRKTQSDDALQNVRDGFD